MELKDITDIATRSDFRIFRQVVEEGGLVKAILIKGGAWSFSRKELDEFSDRAVGCGAKGLVSIKITDKGWQSSLNKVLKEKEKADVNKILGAKRGDLILIVADKPAVANEALGTLRLEIARRMNLIEEDAYAFVWITRFPLLEYNENEQRLEAVHHPFTAPLEEDLHLLDDDPEKVRARSYDLVLNGAEIGGGSIRNHNLQVQERIFNILGVTREEAEAKFGFLLEALKYGAPPHGGMALGFDRLTAIMTGVKSIREVIAFPKTTSAACPLTDAPSSVDEVQLKELGLQRYLE